MAILKCKICGGDMSVSADKTFGTCEYCGSTMTLPKIDDEQRADAFNRGNHFRRIGEFDKALSVYERIVEENPNDAEAHWCCALCRFGIEWVEDPVTMEYLPTCHRASFDIFTNDVDYIAAVELSDGITQKQYKRDAAKISEVQKGILATSQNEKPFDVFICYKESDENGNRTVDSTLAQDIYYQLTEQGLRVFFARITLEDKAGSEYEPYIFAALNSAKVMVVVGTKPENFGAVWVKNEWARFLSIVKHDRSKVLLPCYKNMDPYDLPEQLSVLQSYDMSKIGFIQDLIRGITKVVKADTPKAEAKETVIVNSNTNVAPLLKRAFMFLEDGNFEEADAYCEKVLDLDPENAEAYLGKLMAELKVKNQDDLSNLEHPFDNTNNYQKAYRFGDGKSKEKLENYRLLQIYNRAVNNMNLSDSEDKYKLAAEMFKTIPGFKDADALVEQCYDKAEVCRKDTVYESALSQMAGNAVSGYEAAISTLSTISGWKDADEQIYACQRKIEEIKAKEETDRLVAARIAEEKRVVKEKRKKRIKKIAIITMPIVAVVVVFVILLFTVFIPNSKYNSAISLIETGKYVDAYETLIGLKGYKDSAAKAKEIFGKCISEKLKTASVGDTVKFGHYEQDNHSSNGKEEIEWIVLAKDADRVLVISKYALDGQQYNTSSTSVTWETSSLRKWLNGTFLNAAFSSEEQNSIKITTVTADKNPSYSTLPGNNTTDKVFLLSITEVNKYFSSDDARKCVATDYAIAQGADISSLYYTQGKEATCWWWLRSPGKISGATESVSYIGNILSTYHHANQGVRPALWISLE